MNKNTNIVYAPTINNFIHAEAAMDEEIDQFEDIGAVAMRGVGG